MYQGEDGCLYPLDPVDGAEPVADHEIDDFGYDSNILEIGELDQVTCPWCSCSVTATHRSRLRGGRKKQILGLTVQNVGIYTTLFCWLTEKLIYQAYKALGGNSFAEHIFKEMQDWDVLP